MLMGIVRVNPAPLFAQGRVPGTHLTSLLAYCSCAFVCILHKRHTTKIWDNAENFFPFGRRKRKKIAEEERHKEVPRRRETY